jgi:hypothetical protein
MGFSLRQSSSVSINSGAFRRRPQFEGLADRQRNIKSRLRDYKGKSEQLFDIYAQLELIFPDVQALAVLQHSSRPKKSFIKFRSPSNLVVTRIGDHVVKDRILQALGLHVRQDRIQPPRRGNSRVGYYQNMFTAQTSGALSDLG